MKSIRSIRLSNHIKGITAKDRSILQSRLVCFSELLLLVSDTVCSIPELTQLPTITKDCINTLVTQYPHCPGTLQRCFTLRITINLDSLFMLKLAVKGTINLTFKGFKILFKYLVKVDYFTIGIIDEFNPRWILCKKDSAASKKCSYS